LPPFISRRDVLAFRVGQRLREDRGNRQERQLQRSCPPVFAGAGGVTLHSGQPMTLSFFVMCSASRRLAISSWNCSSLSATRIPRSMNMFATERLPDPCQLRGSGTFLFDGELSMNPMRCRIVPLGGSGAECSL